MQRLSGIVVLLLVVGMVPHSSVAQIPPLRTDETDIRSVREWIDAGAYHVARQKLEKIFRHSDEHGQDRDVLYLLVKSSFQDQDYEQTYQWSGEFVSDYPNDPQFEMALFIQGVSAYQTHRLKEALTLLERFLNEAHDNSQRGAACFWHAMTELDGGNWSQAEDDMQQCYHDSSSQAYRDFILLGWALSLERRGEYSLSADRLEELLSGYPQSDVRTDAQIRLASVSLRRGNIDRTLRELEKTKPQYDQQRQEYLLLQAEANMQLGRYSDARSAYGEFSRQFPESPFIRQALYGLGWARLKANDYPGAQRVFDSLSRGGKDSLAFASMYKSGILLLLQGKLMNALSTFDTLTAVSPYDQDAAQAYYQMGLIQYRGKHYREARRDFQLAARLFPGSTLRPYAYHMLGESNIAIGDFANAQHAFLQVKKLSNDPDILVPSLFRQTIALYHLGRFKSSVESSTEFLQKFQADPFVPQAYLWKGEALFQDYRFDEAERAYGEAIKRLSKDSKRADASYGLAWSLFEQKKYAQAATAFERFTTEFPDDQRILEASLRKADAYLSMGQYDKANALYTSLASERSSGRQAEYASFQLAITYVQRGDADRGVEELKKFLQRYPNSIYSEVAQFDIAWTFFSLEEYQKALDEFRTLLRLYTGSQLLPRVLLNTGDAFYNQKQYDSARVYYRRVVNEFSSSLLVTDALSGLQYTYEAEGRPAAAAEEIEKVIKEKPAGASGEELLLKKGDILFGQGDFAGAIHEYQRLLGMKPTNDVKAKALNQLGRAYELENNPQRAITFYEQILSNLPETDVAPAATLALGSAHMKVHRYGQAVDVFRDFERRYPESPLLPEVRYQVGTALKNLPNADAAIDQFIALIQKHPDNVFADRSRMRLAEIYRGRKKYQPAIDTLTSVVMHRSDDLAAEALLMIGDTYFDMKKIKDAMQAYTDVTRQYTDFPRSIDQAKLGLGKAYEQQRDKKRARTMYEEVAASSTDPALKKEAGERLRRIRR
ncbi:MAG: tetratricopeptide repeat protein [Ignavibacteriae bacterium]|nr:tetratricopeptide repeat protein [Ignavibacteria bacterium]MBI3364313.1 tetratricopeptide repeat protein [Ignavibacteriota bacterium]